MSEDEIRDKLQGAMLHMRFSLMMCLQQLLAGILCMFEYTAGASSWGIRMMHEMLGREGIHISAFDFCQLGMEVTGSHENKIRAKKRMSVMTNSRHLVESCAKPGATGPADENKSREASSSHAKFTKRSSHV